MGEVFPPGGGEDYDAQPHAAIARTREGTGYRGHDGHCDSADDSPHRGGLRQLALSAPGLRGQDLSLEGRLAGAEGNVAPGGQSMRLISPLLGKP